jgi:hypothetical protein
VTTSQFPPGRYGRRREPRRRRWLVWLLGIGVAAVGIGIAVKLYQQYADAPYQARVVRVTDLSDHQVTVTFEVRLPAGAGARCTVLAHTRDGEEVGRAEVTVAPAAPGQPTAVVTYTLATSKRPVTGEVPGCGPTS